MLGREDERNLGERDIAYCLEIQKISKQRSRNEEEMKIEIRKGQNLQSIKTHSP